MLKATEGPWLASFMDETNERLKQVEDGERGRGPTCFPVAEELFAADGRSGEDDDDHLAYELVNGGCAPLRLEHGL